MKCPSCEARNLLAGARMHLLYDSWPDHADADAAKILTSLQVSLPCNCIDAYETIADTTYRLHYS